MVARVMPLPTPVGKANGGIAAEKRNIPHVSASYGKNSSMGRYDGGRRIVKRTHWLGRDTHVSARSHHDHVSSRGLVKLRTTRLALFEPVWRAGQR